MLQTLVLALIVANPAIADADEPATQYLQLCNQRVGVVPPARAGLHWGHEVQIGKERYRPVWDSAWAGSDARPVLVRTTDDPGDPGEQPLMPDDAPEPRDELIILTTDELAADSALLPRFMDLRMAEGWEVRLVTEQDWNVETGGEQDDRAERIRTWLKDNYEDDPGAYLLLIGNPDPWIGDVPMKNMHPFQPIWDWLSDDWQESFAEIPTDFYYADLTETWNCDGDEYWGEYDDDERCVDWGPELYVGRLPVYTGADGLDSILERWIENDLQSDKSYRRDFLLPAAFLGFDEGSGGDYSDHDDGACVMDAVYDALTPDFQAGTTRLYEGSGIITSLYTCEDTISRENVVDYWSDGRGVIFYAGHGWPQSVYRVYWDSDSDSNGYCSPSEEEWVPFIETGDEMELSGAPSGFTFHMSCQTGMPEDRENLGYALLRGGAVATMPASRSCWGTTVGYGEDWEPRPDVLSGTTMGYYYVLDIVNGKTLGEAAAWSKWAIDGDGWGSWNGIAWTTRYQFNLQGDPTRTLEQCIDDSDCDDGSPCNGTESCSDGFCIHVDPVDCSDLNSDCAVGRCDIATGDCYEEPKQEGASCDDGLWCTEGDACNGGVCAGQDMDCGDRVGHSWYCDEDYDQCIWEALEEEDEGCKGCASASSARYRRGLGLLGVAGMLLLSLATAVLRRERDV